MAWTFGPYEVLDLIGLGGMDEVHRARDTRRERLVALKLLPAGLARDPDYLARFRREQTVAARLRNPHVGPDPRSAGDPSPAIDPDGSLLSVPSHGDGLIDVAQETARRAWQCCPTGRGPTCRC